MKYLQPFVSPTAEELRKHWGVEQAKEIDNRNKAIYQQNKKLVRAAKMAIGEVSRDIPGLREMEPPAIQIEYARKFRELADKEREAEQAAIERAEAEAEAKAKREQAQAAQHHHHGHRR